MTIVYMVAGLSPAAEANTWHGTIADAKDAARASGSPLHSLEIHQCEVATSKESLLQALNGEPQWQVMRAWTFSKRGGLVEAEVEVRSAHEMPANLVDTLAGLPDPADDFPQDEGYVDSPATNPEKQKSVAVEVAEWRSRHQWRGSDAAAAKAKAS